MEKEQVNKMEILESSFLMYYRITFLCMLVGLLWTLIAVVVFKKPDWSFCGTLLFLIPAIVTGFKFREIRLCDKSSLWLFLVFLLGILLLVAIHILSALFLAGWLQKATNVSSVFLFIIFIVWFKMKRWKEYLDVNLIDERLSTVIRKSRFITLQIFLFLIVLAYMLLSFGIIQTISTNYAMLFFLNISYIIIAALSASFLLLYKKS